MKSSTPRGELRCIYCGAPVSPKGQGDHVMPAVLGECRNGIRFRQICQDCNSRISPGEQQVAETGPESLHRIELRPPCRRRSSGRRSRPTGAHGAPAPHIIVVGPDGPELAKALGPSEFDRLDQLVLEDSGSPPRFVELRPHLSAARLRDQVQQQGITEKTRVRLICAEPNAAKYEALLKRAFPESRFTWTKVTPPGEQAVAATTSFYATDYYFRAIAKIAFHYHLTQSARFGGDEEEFAPIRNFIMEGGDWRQFFLRPGPFGVGLVKGHTVRGNYSHFMAALEPATGNIIGYVHLFAGARPSASEYHVLVGRVSSRLVYNPRYWVHQYRYAIPRRGHRSMPGEVIPASAFAIPAARPCFVIRYRFP